MSIDSEVTSMTQNIQADYEGLENIGADLTGINKNILNIRTILDTIYNDLPKVTGEGTDVTLTPTRKGRLALIPKGNSTQESTTGKNKLPTGNTHTEVVQGTTIVCEGGIYTMSGANGNSATYSYALNNTYTIQSGDYFHIGNDIANTIVSFSLQQADGTLIVSPAPSPAGRIIDLSEHVGKTVAKVYFYHLASYDGTKIVFKPMICNSSTSTSWEKYTGGIPAPNPSYPFPIKSVTR